MKHLSKYIYLEQKQKKALKRKTKTNKILSQIF